MPIVEVGVKRTGQIALGSFLLVLAFGLRAAAAEHPVKLEKDADCATCHEDKTKGKSVHTAIAMGCTTCHDVKTEGDTTTVNLVSPEQELCFTCHEKSKEKVLHGPYAQGLCVACHDPHTSDFPKQLKADTQDLCLGCHAQSHLKVDQQAKTVTTPWGFTLTFDQIKGMQFIGLDKGEMAGHPMEGHPISGRNTALGKIDGDVTCLSCHQPHASDVRNLMPPGIARDIDLCNKCHKE